MEELYITNSCRDARVICNDRKHKGGFHVLVLIRDDTGNEIAVPYRSIDDKPESQHFPGEDLGLVAI